MLGEENMMPNKLAICPGSFDPITNGHLDIIQRGSTIFDEVIVVIFNNSYKAPLFTPEERAELIKQSTKHLPNVSVDVSDDLLVDLAYVHNANAILHVLRTDRDIEY